MLRRFAVAGFFLLVSATAYAQSMSETAVLELLFAQWDATERTYVVRATPVVPRSSTDRRLRGYDFQKAPEFTMSVFGSVKVQLLPTSEYDAIFVGDCHDGWDAFHTRYPKAKELLSLSRVAMRENEAALYVETRSGCLSGWGGIYFFEKVENQWRVKDQVGMWIS